MKKILLIISTLALVSCGKVHRPEWVCSCEDQKQIEQFVQGSIKDANNMSDEEMEDVIHQLYWVGIKTNCRQVMVLQFPNGEGTEFEPLGDCEVYIHY